MERTAVVTGAGSGIGRAIGLVLAQRGYGVALCDIDSSAVQDAAAEIGRAGGAASVFRCDVADSDEVDAVAREICTTLGVPRLVFCNAGVALGGRDVTRLTKDDWRWIFDVNVLGAWDVARAFAMAAMAAKAPCRIVFTGSEHSLGYPHRGSAAYTASKHALLGLAEAFRGELAGAVETSVFCPGLVQSRIWDAERNRPGHRGERATRAAAVVAQGRDPMDVARLAVEGAERGEFMIVSHPHARRFAQARWQEIDRAFEALQARDPGVGDYDVETIISKLSSAPRDG